MLIGCHGGKTTAANSDVMDTAVGQTFDPHPGTVDPAAVNVLESNEANLRRQGGTVHRAAVIIKLKIDPCICPVDPAVLPQHIFYHSTSSFTGFNPEAMQVDAVHNKVLPEDIMDTT